MVLSERTVNDKIKVHQMAAQKYTTFPCNNMLVFVNN